jgi:hypothetical protein
MLKAKIMSQPEYADYRDSAGNPINYLLQVLTSGYISNTKHGVFDNAKFVQIASITQSDEIDPQEITAAWENMLEDDKHPEIKQFARDLVVYAFLTSADNGGNKDLFKYVPNSWKFDSGYAEFMENQLEKFKQGTYEFTDDDRMSVVLNNADDTFFVRTVKEDKMTVLKSQDGTPKLMAGVRLKDRPVVVNGKLVITTDVEFAFDSAASAPDYVKTVQYDEATRKPIEVVYVKTDDAGMINGRMYPVYAQVNPKTTKFEGGNRVYGYGMPNRISKTSNDESGENKDKRLRAPYIRSDEFIKKLIQQKAAVTTTISEDGQLAPQASRNLELAIYETIVNGREVEQANIAQ